MKGWSNPVMQGASNSSENYNRLYHTDGNFRKLFAYGAKLNSNQRFEVSLKITLVLFFEKYIEINVFSTRKFTG